MCARFGLDASKEVLEGLFGIDIPFEVPAAYNIAPTDPVLAFDGKQAAYYRWGLVPSWSKDLSGGARMINARSETVAEKPAYRAAFRERRCIVPCSGYFEWSDEFPTDLFGQPDTKAKAAKQPRFYHDPSGDLLTFAGLYEFWKGPETVVATCTILTTEPNAFAAQWHDRMPVLLNRDARDIWLDPSAPEPVLEGVLKSYSGELEAYKVSTAMSNPRFKFAEAMQPI